MTNNIEKLHPHEDVILKKFGDDLRSFVDDRLESTGLTLGGVVGSLEAVKFELLMSGMFNEAMGED